MTAKKPSGTAPVKSASSSKERDIFADKKFFKSQPVEVTYAFDKSLVELLGSVESFMKENNPDREPDMNLFVGDLIESAIEKSPSFTRWMQTRNGQNNGGGSEFSNADDKAAKVNGSSKPATV